MTRRSRLIFVIVLVLLLVDLGPSLGQTTKTFTGKISEITKGTELDIARRDIFYLVRLEEHPKIKFRLTPEDAVRFGLIEGTGTSGVLTPKMSKGLGWKVKLTCDARYAGERQAPIYKVTALERLDG